MTDKFSTWLNKPECFTDLLPCARLVIRRAEQLGITLDDSYMQAGDSGEYQAAVASNLWQFIKEESESIAQKATKYLVELDYKGLATFISREFIDSCIDQRRNDSPFHAYYRHMRSVLSEAKDINYKPMPRTGSYFAWSHKPDLAFLPDDNNFRIKNLNFKEWTSSTISFSEIHKKTAMIQLSHHYWDESLRVILDDYLHPIRELVTFVTVKYPLIPSVEYESDTADDDGEESQRTPRDTFVNPDSSGGDDSWMRQLPVLGQSIIETDLERIAQDAVAKLTSKERIVLCSLEASLTPEEIAANLGKKGVSSVSNYKADAIKKLHKEWVRWSLPDSEYYSVAEDELRIFYKKVISSCKEAIDCRDSREG
ncbi:MAG: hypothetical protein PHU01_05600 [Desulfuromonadaceae bacterium]|nr:hypothetical protein [Desulfuromonadaceae bacterium]